MKSPPKIPFYWNKQSNRQLRQIHWNIIENNVLVVLLYEFLKRIGVCLVASLTDDFQLREKKANLVNRFSFRTLSQTKYTSIWWMSGMNRRSWTTSVIDTPAELVSAHNELRLPGLSVTVTLNLNSRPTAIKPRSRQRPNRFVSMLPPHRIKTTLQKKKEANWVGLPERAESSGIYFLFLSSFKWPDKIAARPVAPTNRNSVPFYQPTIHHNQKCVIQTHQLLRPHTSPIQPNVTWPAWSIAPWWRPFCRLAV